MCELVFAIKFGLVKQKTRIVGRKAFAANSASCLEADCWSSDDKKKIMEYINNESSVEMVDQQIVDFRQFADEQACPAVF